MLFLNAIKAVLFVLNVSTYLNQYLLTASIFSTVLLY